MRGKNNIKYKRISCIFKLQITYRKHKYLKKIIKYQKRKVLYTHIIIQLAMLTYTKLKK